MSDITINIPHQLTRAEAKARIQKGLDSHRHKSGALFAEIRETWTDNRMDFDLAVMGQTITGQVLVEDHAAVVNVALPWLLKAVASQFAPRIEGEVRTLLEHKPEA